MAGLADSMNFINGRKLNDYFPNVEFFSMPYKENKESGCDSLHIPTLGILT